jgi:FkbM family methyltransferase
MIQKLKTFCRVNFEKLIGKSPIFKIQKKLAFKRVGGEQYGFWNINLDGINSNSVVYSFGVGTDISFDLEMIKLTDCKIYAFDPTPESIKWVSEQKLPSNFIFQPYGIANYNGKAKFYKPSNENYISHSTTNNHNTKNDYIEVDVRTIEKLMTLNGHSKVEVVKMDIEGAEYDVIPDVLLSKRKI